MTNNIYVGFHIRWDGSKYKWITLGPMIFVGITTLIAATMNIVNIYVPQISVAKTQVQGVINTSLTTVIIICLVIIVKDALPRWFSVKGK